jgi:hypothetical protein
MELFKMSLSAILTNVLIVNDVVAYLHQALMWIIWSNQTEIGSYEIGKSRPL